MEGVGELLRKWKNRLSHNSEESRHFGLAVARRGDSLGHDHNGSRSFLVSSNPEELAQSEPCSRTVVPLPVPRRKSRRWDSGGGIGLGTRGGLENSGPFARITGDSALQDEGEDRFWDRDDMIDAEESAGSGRSARNGSTPSVLRMREVRKGKSSQVASSSSLEGAVAWSGEASNSRSVGPRNGFESQDTMTESSSTPVKYTAAEIQQSTELPNGQVMALQDMVDRSPQPLGSHRRADGPEMVHTTSSAIPGNLLLSATHSAAVDSFRPSTSSGLGSSVLTTRRRDPGRSQQEAEEAEVEERSTAPADRAEDCTVPQKKPAVARTSTSGNAVCGGLAGAVVSVCIHPIDTIKTIIQSQRGKGATAAGPTLSRFISERGVGGLYKGIAANLATSAPISAVYTSTYEAVKENLLHHLPPGWAPVAHCMAGACASVATSVIFTPSEAVKQRMQISTQYPNSFAALVGMARTEGIPSLYDGLAAVLARNIPNSIIKFLVYESLKKKVLQLQTERQLRMHRQDPSSRNIASSSLTTVNQLLVGGAAGSTAAFFTTPFDVIKTRMQTSIAGVAQYSSVGDAFVSILRDEGVPGLYRGVAPRLLIYLSQGAIFFASYELLRRLLVLTPQRSPVRPLSVSSGSDRKVVKEGELMSESC